MAAVIARVTGTALAPGVSRNGRYYSREAIGKAVDRAKARIADGKRPISMRSHHAAGDDSVRIAGRVAEIWQDPETGAAKYIGDIADTAAGRDIAALTDDSDGKPAFLRGVSIRGAWMAEPRTERVEGRDVTTSDDLEIQGLDFTAEPGVDAADVAHLPKRPAPGESADDTPYPITESAPEAVVSVPTVESTAVAEKGAPALKSGKPATPQTKAKSYADPGYQDDKMKRYALDTKTEALAAWRFVHQDKNAKNYTANQLKRIKQRIAKALKGFGVKVDPTEHYLILPAEQLTESADIAECMGCYDDEATKGSFYVTLTNGPVSVSVSSYRVDPADLDLIGRAAMDGACKALATLDPDMDGDIDVPGADAEDTDHDMDDEPDDASDEPSANVPGTLCPCDCGCAIPVTVTACPCECGDCDVCGSAGGECAPESSAPVAESNSAETAPAAAAEPTPAPDPVADPNPETEASDVSEPTTPAVETSPATDTAAAPAAATPTFTFEQMMALLTAAGRPTEAAPAPAAPVAEATPAPVAESQEQMIARLVAEGVANAQRDFVQTLAESGALAGRKGLTAQAPGSQAPAAPLAEGTNSYGMPAGAPDKPLHQYSTEELNRWTGPMVMEHAVGHYLHRGQ